MATLIHGDCLTKMKALPDKSVDLFVCDLPYGCLTNKPLKDGTPGETKGGKHYSAKPAGGGVATRRREAGDGGMFGCSWDIPIDLPQFWEQVKRLARDDHTPVLMFCSTKFGYELIKSNPDWFRYDLVWNKIRGVSFLSANKMPLRSHEMLYVFAKKGAAYYRKDIEGDFPGTSGGTGNVGGSIYGCAEPTRTNPIQRHGTREGIRCVTSVVTIPSQRGKGKHPTQKPDDLYAWLIERYSKEGDTVLDPTAGSFASVFTATKMGRKAIGIEKDDTFFAKAIATLHQKTTHTLGQ